MPIDTKTHLSAKTEDDGPMSQHNDDDKLIKLVQSSTRNLMGSFRDKAALLSKCSDDIKLLLREGYDVKVAKETAEKFFDKKYARGYQFSRTAYN